MEELKKVAAKNKELKRSAGGSEQLKQIKLKTQKVIGANDKLKEKLLEWKPELARRKEKLLKMKKHYFEIHEKLKRMKEKKKEMRKQRELYERKLTAKQKPSKVSPKQSSRRDRSLNKSLNQSAFDYSLEDLEVSGINFQTTKLRVTSSFFQNYYFFEFYKDGENHPNEAAYTNCS